MQELTGGLGGVVGIEGRKIDGSVARKIEGPSMPKEMIQGSRGTRKMDLGVERAEVLGGIELEVLQIWSLDFQEARHFLHQMVEEVLVGGVVLLFFLFVVGREHVRLEMIQIGSQFDPGRSVQDAEPPLPKIHGIDLLEVSFLGQIEVEVLVVLEDNQAGSLHSRSGENRLQLLGEMLGSDVEVSKDDPEQCLWVSQDLGGQDLSGEGISLQESVRVILSRLVIQADDPELMGSGEVEEEPVVLPGKGPALLVVDTPEELVLRESLGQKLLGVMLVSGPEHLQSQHHPAMPHHFSQDLDVGLLGLEKGVIIPTEDEMGALASLD
jgi:hypothetical protein